MPRPSARLSAKNGSSKPSPLGKAASSATSPKRPAPQSSPASSRSLRQRSASKCSSYVEQASSGEDEDQDAGVSSGYDDDDAASVSPSSATDESEGEDASESDAPPRKKQKSTKASSSALSAKHKGQGELWRQGVKTGLGPGTQVIIDKPRARSPGGVPYKDDEIHPNTMLFLADLARNNDREWLKMHDPDYRTSWKDWMDFLEPLQTRITEVDETVPELPLKDVIFRIYRDIRFSPDPTPYKAHFSAAWSRTGRKGPFACYYVQIKPGASLVGGGLWMPDAGQLRALRRDIDRRPNRIKDVLLNAQVRKQLLAGAPPDRKKVVKAFMSHNAESALKKRPKDYPADHADIGLLRLKNYTMGCKLADDEVLGPRALDRVCEIIRALLPFVTYLNSVVMPDEPASSSDEENDADAANSAAGSEAGDED